MYAIRSYYVLLWQEPQSLQIGVDAPPDGSWVQQPIFLGQTNLGDWRDVRRSHGPLIGCLSSIISLVKLSATTLLVKQLAHGLEEVNVGMEVVIDSGQQVGGLSRGEATVSDVATDDRPILLLDEGLVVLLVGSGAGEGDLVLLTVARQGAIDEEAIVVSYNFV